MAELDYNTLKRHCTTFENIDRYEEFLISIEQLIDEDQISVFYPKNVFNTEKRLEIHIFYGDYLLSISEEPQGATFTKTNFSEVVRVKLTAKDRYKPVLLEIDFSSGDKLTLNSHEDISEARQFEFAEKIRTVFKLL